MRALGIGGLVVTLLSAMFHWHVMQNGAMLVGRNSNSFAGDMKRMPRLLVTFVCYPVRALMARSHSVEVAGEAEEMEIAA